MGKYMLGSQLRTTAIFTYVIVYKRYKRFNILHFYFFITACSQNNVLSV